MSKSRRQEATRREREGKAKRRPEREPKQPKVPRSYRPSGRA